jgi:radical SAM superfamily enzyme YgiQ (UPF0313 family)
MKFIDKKAAFPPLGLMTIASWFRDDFNVRLIDCNIEKLSEKDIIWADYILTSSMLIQKNSLHEIIKLCNKLNKPVICGGPYPTTSPDDFSESASIVIGEAETIMSGLVDDIRNDQLMKKYIAIEKIDISTTPPPRFDIIKIHKYASMLLQFSRGCPFNCEFCDIIEMYGRTSRTKSPEQFLNELEVLYNTEYRGPFFIVDDNFIGNKKKVKELLREIIIWQKKRGFPFEFYTEASVNLAQDDELLELMTSAGFNMVFLGLETPDTETLLKTGKKQNTRNSLEESIHIIQRKGIEVTGGFIVGFDSDPENIFELQKQFIQKASIPFAMVGLLMALPQTQLFRRLEKEGRLINKSNGNNTHHLDLNFVPIRNKGELIEGYKNLLKEIYDPRNYFRRCRDLIINYMPFKRNAKKKFKWRNFRFINFYYSARAFLYSLFKQGFSKYGLLYYKYLLEVLIKKPLYFIQAVTLAVYGYHFIRITNEILKKNVSLSKDIVRDIIPESSNKPVAIN